MSGTITHPRLERARVLIFDIETTPNLGYVWGKWKQNVVRFESEWHMLSFAWKWLGEKHTHVLGLDDFELYDTDPADDFALVKTLRDLLDEADVAIAHNLAGFDAPRVNARMLVHGIDPPSPYREIDTLRVAKKAFAFNSNRLDDLCRALGIGQKADTGGFDTWLRCMAGDPSAWARMKRYNRQDVAILEELYERLVPWVPNHPNMALLDDRPTACPRCGDEAGFESKGWRYYQVTRRRVWRCKACGGSVASRRLEKHDAGMVPA